jgi:proliferating cell nuclear antigen
VAEYEMKLMDIDTDTLGIPDTEYDCKVTMPSSEFAVSISVTQAVSLSFSLKYLINFSKSTGLCQHVELKMSADVPLLVSQLSIGALCDVN